LAPGLDRAAGHHRTAHRPATHRRPRPAAADRSADGPGPSSPLRGRHHDDPPPLRHPTPARRSRRGRRRDPALARPLLRRRPRWGDLAMRTPPRASPWAVGAALLTLVIAVASLRSLIYRGPVSVLMRGIGGLTVGALRPLGTGIGTTFGRVSALFFAAVAAFRGTTLLGLAGTA